jgi:hypothetical protein
MSRDINQAIAAPSGYVVLQMSLDTREPDLDSALPCVGFWVHRKETDDGDHIFTNVTPITAFGGVDPDNHVLKLPDGRWFIPNDGLFATLDEWREVVEAEAMQRLGVVT